MSEYDLLLKALENTATCLEAHLQRFNPVINSDQNGIPEANLTMQFAHQCLKNGWFVYPETSNVVKNTDDVKPIRVDLHVICEGQFMLTVEAKKFYSADKGKSIILDYTRACSLQYPHHLPHYVLLLAITEDFEYAQWWCNSENWDNKSDVWKALAGILQSDGMVTSSLPMHADGKTHHLLYALAKV